MNQLRRTWILYVLLQFGLQGAQWQIHSEKELKREKNWWTKVERLGAVISHQEVEGQLQFLQAINNLSFRGGLGSQGQHALCKQAEQQWPHTDSRVTGPPCRLITDWMQVSLYGQGLQKCYCFISTNACNFVLRLVVHLWLVIKQLYSWKLHLDQRVEEKMCYIRVSYDIWLERSHNSHNHRNQRHIPQI